MSESKASLAEIDGQLYRDHEAKKARHVHKRIIDPKDPESNPVKDYFLQKNRIRAASLGANGADLIKDPKMIKKIEDFADEDYKNGLRAQKNTDDERNKSENLMYDGKLKESKILGPNAGEAAFVTAINDAIRNKQGVGVIMLDADSFKIANEKYGHLGADELLRLIGRASRRTTHRRNDLIIRFGGEEIVIVMPGLQKELLREKAEMVSTNYKNLQRPFLVQAESTIDPAQQQQLRRDRNLPQFPQLSQLETLSIGATYFHPDDPRIKSLKNGDLIKVLTAEADDAVLASKGLGKDQVNLYSEIDDKFKKNTMPQAA